MKKSLSSALGGFFALLFAMWAQDYRASLLGRVADASGAGVPSATIVVTDEATRFSYRTESNAEGHYLIPLLDPGAYTVEVEAAGFKKIRQEGLSIQTGAKMTLNFQLELGQVTESVTVRGESPLLETASADIAQVIDRRFVDLLYIPNRNPLALVSLTAGVRGGGGRFSDSGQHYLNILGGAGQDGRNEIVVDGASVTMPRQGGALAVSPSGDSVEELRVQTTMLDASYGRSNGGVISYATRSGTNDLHGSFEYFIRNKALNANSWLNNRKGLPRADDPRKFYSGALGGPVAIPKLYDGRNRTFFFASAQYDSRWSVPTYGGRVPSELERQGDFSRTLSAKGTPLVIYNPYTTGIQGSKAVRQPWPGNRIPSAMFNKTGETIMNVYPKPTQGAPAQIGVYNWFEQGRANNPAKQISTRLDHMLSPKHRVFGRFAYMDWSVDFTKLPPGLRNAPVGGDPGGDLRHFYNATFNDDYTFTPTLIGSLRFSFNRYWSDTWFSGNVQDPKALNLHPDILANQMRPSWPGIDMAEGFIRLGHRFKIRANDTYVLTPTVTTLRRSHNLRFGADIRRLNWNEISPDSRAGGYFNFRPTFSQEDPWLAATSQTSGTAMADLLLGIPASGTISGPTPYSMRGHYAAFYVQDDWKVSQRLTVNLGLRWEFEKPWTERFDRMLYGFDTGGPSPLQIPGLDLRGGLLFAGIDGNPRQQGINDWNNFGPRIGIAWQVAPKTVIRAGYGLFYSSLLDNLDTQIPVPLTFSTNIPYIGTVDRGATPYTTLANPFPQGVPKPTGNSEGRAALIGDSISPVHHPKVLPYNQQWQFGFQRELPWQSKFEANFLRVLNVKGIEGFNLNETPDLYLPLGTAENVQVPNPFYGVIPSTRPLGASATVAQRQLWRRFPQYSSVSVRGFNTNTIVYHALQMNFEKRFSHGLTLLWNHSISKMFDNNVTSLINERHYRTISGMDRPHIMNLAFVYEMPFGKQRTWLNTGWLSHVAGGWSVSGRVYYGSGAPLSISDANGRPIRLYNAAKSGAVNERLGDKVDPVTKEVLNPYFDTKAFQSLPTQYMVSPEPPVFGELRAPSSRGLDLTVMKRFTIRERWNVDLRADAENALNLVNFGGPGTNMASKGTFGVIQTAGAPRIIQLTVRATF
ncbi:MAG: TonB-dependent receptor [Bryobacteraceae bacterium]|nr:TonB-dependent receptor [Bryobacteraceae bacterium]